MYKSMSLAELRLYGVLCNLTDHHDLCYAENAQLAAQLGVTSNHVSHMLSNLAKKGWITIAYVSTYFTPLSRRAERTIKVRRSSHATR